MDIIKDYKRRAFRNWIIIGALVVLTACCFVWANMVGSFNYSAETVVKAIFTPDAVDNQIHTVIWRLRLPMSVIALLVGVALAMAGAQMQTILDNPLAESFTLGISAAAAFGGAASIVLGWTVIPQPQFNLAFIAWICAVLASLIIAGVATVRGGSNQTMILLGIVQAMLALMQYMATVEALQQIVFWMMGSMTRATWIGNGILAAVVVLCIPFFVINGWKLTALGLGEARAEAMGINVPRLRITTLLVVSVLAATAVAFSGIIGFVGLVGSHIARLIVGEDQRYFLPASMAVGGLVMVAAHVGSQIVNPGIAIPIGIVTSLIGVPFFLAIILGRRRAL